MTGRTILSLFDYTGQWSQPYWDAGYNVIEVDIKHGHDANTITAAWCMEMMDTLNGVIDGILSAPPCTEMSVSGAQYWPQKDADGRTAAAVELVLQVIRCVKFCKPDWWVLENPVGRLNKLVPSLRRYGPWYFQPCEFGDPYTKKTGLWGKFNRNLVRTPVEPVRVCPQGSWLQRLGGKSQKTKSLRSATPPGFARAFFNANS